MTKNISAKLYERIIAEVNEYKAGKDDVSLDRFIQHVANKAKNAASSVAVMPLGERSMNTTNQHNNAPRPLPNDIFNPKVDRISHSTPISGHTDVPTIEYSHLAMTKDAIAKRKSDAKRNQEITMLESFNQDAHELVQIWKDVQNEDREAVNKQIGRCLRRAQRITRVHIEDGLRPGGAGRRWHLGAGFFYNLPLEYFIAHFTSIGDEVQDLEEHMTALRKLLRRADKYEAKTPDDERKVWCRNNDWSFVRFAVIAEAEESEADMEE